MRAVWKDFGVVVYDTKNGLSKGNDKSASKTVYSSFFEGRNNAVMSLLDVIISATFY